jgi:hypothetical protein
MADLDDPADRLAAWQDALQAAELTARLVSDAIRLEPDGAHTSDDAIADLATRVAAASDTASQRATQAAIRAGGNTPP